MATTDTTNTNNDDTTVDDVDTLTVPIFPQDTGSDPYQKLWQAHKERMTTFRPCNFFAMPVELSPLLCALCGWEVVSPSAAVLSCRNCQAKTAIQIPSRLTAGSPAHQKLIAHFQQQLWTCHKDYCLFRGEAKSIVEKKQHASTVVPTALSRMLPRHSSHELIACPQASSCWPLVYPRYTRLFSLLQRLSISKLDMKIPNHVELYRQEDAEDTTVLPLRLLDCLLAFAKQEEDDGEECSTAVIRNNQDRRVAQAALSLVMFGWDCVEKEQDENSTCAVECVFCLVRKAVSDKEHKGAGWNDCMSAHRYFCPWVCGFADPKAPPLWKVLADSLLDADPTILIKDGGAPGTPPWLEIRRLLKAGVSRKRLKLSDAVLE